MKEILLRQMAEINRTCDMSMMLVKTLSIL